MMEGGVVDDRFEILEVWRRPLRGDASAAVRVLAKVEAGAYGPEEYAVGISTRADAQLSPLLDEADLFTGLSFAEAHWVAAVLASAADRVEDAESLLFDLRVPVDLAWREVELASEVVEPGGLRSAPLVPWEPEEVGTGPSRYAIAIWANLIEFVLSVGLCQAVLFAAALAFGAIDREPGQGRLHHPLTVLCVSLLAILLITDLIGINRGEVTRLWIFLACLFQIPAAWICARLRRPAVAIAIVVATSIVHATLGTSVVGFVVP